MANFSKGRSAYIEWGETEIVVLKRMFAASPWPDILKAFPGRSRGAINQYARKVLRLERAINKRVNWTLDEDLILHRDYPRESDDVLAEHLPRHTLIAIQRRASSLKILRPRAEAREHTRPVNAIAARLYKERLLANIKRPSLARRCGYAVGQILGWELGKATPDIECVLNWAQALGFDLVLVKLEQPSVVKIEDFTIPYPDKRKLMGGR